ncbi:hypothetical protein [Actinophytocola algeriensis]|jgi:hypothetical protein|uniref:Uncharacterized protein n=1 Tax=Actinophytocola algeriensis TaxID=1768010 RepID=A0A7W7Q1J2_9PSEU|nr:hypothetical protein [Actinophytocola algeriensis]MBB4905138.1 hypothetical protein [Actinophytocola algeriensis]MBE1473177.1 hypothetical protein [Actinophytocola algeriensis]
MSVVVLVLFFSVIAAVIGALAAMVVKDKPLYGVYALCVLMGPGTILGFTYLVVSGG